MPDATSCYRRTAVRVTFLGPILIALGACASTPAPTLELDRARAALQRAEKAEGEAYAPVDLRLARESLQAGQSLLEQRRHEPAQRALQRAEARAELAASKAEAARLRAEIQAREADNAALRRELLGGGQTP